MPSDQFLWGVHGLPVPSGLRRRASVAASVSRRDRTSLKAVGKGHARFRSLSL